MTAAPRPPAEVMRLARMGAAFPHRLSFMRVLIRRLARERAKVRRTLWQIDAEGHGRAVYQLTLGSRRYSLVAISTALDDDKRSDRVIAEAWDASFALFDGVPGAEDLDRLAETLPRQEAGRFRPSELTLSRANKSVRFFNHVVERLAEGRQPDAVMLARIGYLMRTTAVYGNGKFGICDRARIKARPELYGAFQAEMLTVWLIRGFTHDLAEHVARMRNPDTAMRLSPASRRALGIGNATGLGMAPFLVNHPDLLHVWMAARETALARVLAEGRLSGARRDRLGTLMARAARHLEEWQVEDERQSARTECLRGEWAEMRRLWETGEIDRPSEMLAAASGFSLECQELVAALLIEPFGELVDDLGEALAAEGAPPLAPGMSLGALGTLIRRDWGWALALDFTDREQLAQFWYVSEAKFEPRLGLRFKEPGAERESPLDVARRVRALAEALGDSPGETPLAEFLARNPEHRFAAQRIQGCAAMAYGEIRDNLLAATCLPIDMLRFKLAFFGAAKFDPKSDRWTRINMYQGAPCFDMLETGDPDDWWLPVTGRAEASA